MEGLILRRSLNVVILKVSSNNSVNGLGSIRLTDAEGNPLTGVKAGTAPKANMRPKAVIRFEGNNVNQANEIDPLSKC